MNIKLEDIIYAVVPNCKNNFKAVRESLKKCLDDIEEDLEVCKSNIHEILASSKSLIRDFDPNDLVFDANLVDFLCGEKKERDVKADTAKKKSSLYWAIILTSYIADKDDNRLEFISIYKVCFDILSLYFDSSLRDSQILKLYPDDINNAHEQWIHFLEGELHEWELNTSFYVILCVIIYLAIVSRKEPLEIRSRIGAKCHTLISQLIAQIELTGAEKRIKENYLKDYLGRIEKDFGETEIRSGFLTTTCTRSVDDAVGAFPIPEYYQERTALIKNLIETGFKDSNTLFLTGDRGIGKSLFAKSYALRCAKGDNVRTECRYEHIIWTTYDAAGIYATISSLACTENVTGDLFENKIEMMKELAKGGETPCLLIVDNFDFDTKESLINEITSDAFSNLIKTGWHILFTTKNNMKNIKLSVVRQEEIPPLSIDELCSLFCNLLVDGTKLETKKLKVVINTYLNCNTYLVSLAAGLCDMLLDRECETISEALDYIIRAFENLNVSNLDVSMLADKDESDLTFMEHYRTMFELSNIKDNKDKVELLNNLALVPLSGVKRSSFFKDAFEEEKQADMQAICDELILSRWIINENRNISLHPMVREIIKDSDVQVKSVKKYIETVNKKRHSVSFWDAFESIESLKAIYQIIDDKDWENEPKDILLEYCQLVSMISTHYDTLHGFQKEAYDFGCRAVELLNQYISLQKELYNDEKVILAELYNDCGYSILHYMPLQKMQAHHNEAKNTFEIAYENIKKAEKIVGKSNASLLNEETDFEFALVQTHIQGNLAACLYTNNEYEKGISIHLNELEYRKKLRAITEKDETMQEKLKIAIGNSHKGIASGLFYTGKGKDIRGENGFKDLYKSYCHHQEASKFYNTENVNHNMLIAMVRMLGAVIELIEKHFKEFSEKEDINILIENSFKNCLSAAQFYSKLNFNIPKESEDWINKTVKLGEITFENNLGTLYIVEIIKQICDCYEDNEKLKELVDINSKLIAIIWDKERKKSR